MKNFHALIPFDAAGQETFESYKQDLWYISFLRRLELLDGGSACPWRRSAGKISGFEETP